MKNIYNRIKRTTLVGAASLMLMGCADFVDILPKDLIVEDNFWDEKTDVEQMVFGCYTQLQSDAVIERFMAWGELRSDNLYNGTNIQDNGSLYELMRENLLSTNGYTSWTSVYAVINRCNLIIARAPEVAQKDPTYLASDVRATIAEMKTLRALCYFYLIRAFKDVPYYTHPVTEEEQVASLPATSFDKVLAALIADLEGCRTDAMKAYPNKRFNTGRITQDAIHALLADMYLWQGDYQKAEQYCQLVIDSKQQQFDRESEGSNSIGATGPRLMKHADDAGRGYPLYSNELGSNSYGNAYNAIFGDGSCFESIFEVVYEPSKINDPDYLSNTAVGRLYGEYTGKEKTNMGKGFVAPADLIGTDMKNTTQAYYQKSDSRYYENIVADKDFTSFQVRKYTHSSVVIEKNPGSDAFVVGMTRGLEDANWIFYRLTDVMLMQAEALACQMVGDGSETDEELRKKAFYLVYVVNERSAMGTSALKLEEHTAKEAIIQLVLEERQRELMFEGKRWFDLLRQARRDESTKIIRSKVTSKFTNSTGSGLFMSMESLYWPYNRDEVKRNTYLEQKSYYANESEGSFETTN